MRRPRSASLNLVPVPETTEVLPRTDCTIYEVGRWGELIPTSERTLEGEHCKDGKNI